MSRISAREFATEVQRFLEKYDVSAQEISLRAGLQADRISSIFRRKSRVGSVVNTMTQVKIRSAMSDYAAENYAVNPPAKNRPSNGISIED